MSGKLRILGFILAALGVLGIVFPKVANPWLNNLINFSWFGYVIEAILIIIGLLLLFKKNKKTLTVN